MTPINLEVMVLESGEIKQKKLHRIQKKSWKRVKILDIRLMKVERARINKLMMGGEGKS